MKSRMFTEPQQGADYQTLRNVAAAAEELGFDAFFRSDHYLKMGDVSGLPGPTDAWTTLAGLAVGPSRIRLGTLLTAALFRRPGPLAVTGAPARPEERRRGRVRLGGGLVRGRAVRVRHPVPLAGRALRPSGGATRSNHRAV